MFLNQKKRPSKARILLFEDGTKMLFSSKAKALENAPIKASLLCKGCQVVYTAWLRFTPKRVVWFKDIIGFCPYCLNTQAELVSWEEQNVNNI